jgi:ubiquinone/menaquinone biosynthesis C-methylase UbiE
MSENVKLRTTFNNVSSLYDSVRPNYPEQLFDDLIETVQLQKDAKLLEIGPGTGQATKPFVKRGFNITAVELGNNLADFVRKKFADNNNFKVITGAFENIDLKDKSFDLIYSATAFHWIKSEIKFSKPYEILKKGGHLAIIHTNHVSKEKEDKFFYACQPIYKKYKPGGKYNDKLKPILEKELKPKEYDNNFFEQVLFETYPVDISYSADEYIKLLNTYSPTLSMETEQRNKFLNEIKELINNKFDGNIEKNFAMSLTILRKKDSQ